MHLFIHLFMYFIYLLSINLLCYQFILIFITSVTSMYTTEPSTEREFNKDDNRTSSYRWFIFLGLYLNDCFYHIQPRGQVRMLSLFSNSSCLVLFYSSHSYLVLILSSFALFLILHFFFSPCFFLVFNIQLIFFLCHLPVLLLISFTFY